MRAMREYGLLLRDAGYTAMVGFRFEEMRDSSRHVSRVKCQDLLLVPALFEYTFFCSRLFVISFGLERGWP